MRAPDLRDVARVVAPLALVLWPARAEAYCRTTTCDAVDSSGDCQRDDDGCSTVGELLYWAQRCITYNVQIDGSERGFTWETLDGLVSTGFRQWERVNCADGPPSFRIINLNETEGPATCNVPEYNKTATDLANANVWMFRDKHWPHPGVSSTLALTTVSFITRTGQIVDADVELNSFAVSNFTTTDQLAAVGTDLQSIVTHEAGHFLGLAHTRQTEATMHDFYSVGTTEMRTLHADDIAGICEIYPAGRDVPDCTTGEPFGGFAPGCKEPATSTYTPATLLPEDEPEASCRCGVARSASTAREYRLSLAALLAAALLSVRRRRRAPR